MNILELSDQEIVRRNNLQQLRDLGIDPYYGKVSDDGRCQGYFYKMNVRLEGDDILYLSGYSVLRDERSAQPVTGTLTYKFKCVSGKGKVPRPQ